MFYTYVHIRSDNDQVFYVGKGKDDRMQSKRSRNKHWHNIVAKVGYRVEYVGLWFTEAEAYDHEKSLIAYYRSQGARLCNQTIGGEGVVGLSHSNESKAKFSASTKAMWDDPDLKKERMDAMRKGWQSEKSKEKARKNLEKMKQSLDQKSHQKYMSDLTKARWADPEFKAIQAEKSKARWADPEFKERIRQIQIERHRLRKLEKEKPDTL